MRVAIYARYSDDLQRDASIEDQIRLCRERADANGWTVVNCYTDAAISGDNIILRPGVQQLIADAAAHKFDVILIEALDRLTRDQEHASGIYKRFTFLGIKLHTLSEGEITEIHIGFKGTMNALFLKDMADKVRRGQRGRVENGKAGGGLCYGYDVVKKFDENGEPIRGERKINEDHARVVRRVFEEYVAGKSPKAIAKDLNADGIPGPTNKGWSASTINGNWRRGAGVLNNDLYNGEIVWNKVRYPKNPDTGKHVTRNNPPEEWIRKAVPELRIVAQEVWDKAKARQLTLRSRKEKPEFWQHQRPRYLLSFLLKCGECGGGMSKISHSRYGCSTQRNKGETLCSNRRTIRQDILEHTVLTVLQHHLMSPDLVSEFCEEYTAHINRLRMERNASMEGYRNELAKIERREKRIVEAIMDGFASDALKTEMDNLVARKAELNALISGTKEAPVLLHPKMSERYRQEVSRLIEAVQDENHRHEAIELIRSLIDKVVLHPDPGSKGLLIDLHGDLAGILNIAIDKGKAFAGSEVDLKQIRLVAGLDEQSANGEQVKSVALRAHHLQFSWC